MKRAARPHACHGKGKEQALARKDSWLGKGADAGMFGLPPDVWRARYGDQVDVYGGESSLDDLMGALEL